MLATTPTWLTPTEALTRGFVFADNSVATTTPIEEVLQRQGFRIGDMQLMVRYEDGSELTELPPVYRLPNAPPWFWGMVNLHGTLVPVFDLCEFFGMERNSDTKRMLLVLGHETQLAGVVIDGLPQRLRPHRQDRLNDAAIPAVLSDCVEHCYRVGEQDWLDFRYAVLFERLAAELTQ